MVLVQFAEFTAAKEEERAIPDADPRQRSVVDRRRKKSATRALQGFVQNSRFRERIICTRQRKLQFLLQSPIGVRHDLAEPANRQLSHSSGTYVPAHSIGDDKQKTLVSLTAEVESGIVVLLALAVADYLTRSKSPRIFTHNVRRPAGIFGNPACKY
jgi:hypothetical protein